MEVHHIVPKCMGGDDNRSNLIVLSSVAHAILSVYQSDFYGRPCIHRRQLKYLPPELKGRGRYWIRQQAIRANAARKNTARSMECRLKQSKSQIEDWATNETRRQVVSAKMAETNSKLHPCPTCGKLMNAGNLSQHIKRAKCG